MQAHSTLASQRLRHSQILEIMGMAYNTVRQCIALAEIGNRAVLKPKAVERKAGQKRKLTQQQEEQVQRPMYDK
jgi:hypothetical protein